MSKLLSIIVPCYNVEKYVESCLESCTNQGIALCDYEIVVINDGSTDNTILRVSDFCEKNPDVNVVFVNQTNQGLSAARNAGLLHSKGDYVMFVDSDDTICPKVLTGVLNEAFSNNLDMMWFQHCLVNEYNELLPLPNEDCKINASCAIRDGLDFITHEFNHSCMACMFIYRRQFLLENNIQFKDGLYLEDIVFTLSCLRQCKRIKYYPVCAYRYLIRSNSIMRDPKKTFKRSKDAISVASMIVDLYRDVERHGARAWVNDFANAIIQYNLRRLVKNRARSSYSDCVRLLKNLNMLPLPESLRYKQKALTQVFNISPSLYWAITSKMK